MSSRKRVSTVFPDLTHSVSAAVVCPECARLEERLRLLNASLTQTNDTNAKLLLERTDRERVAAEAVGLILRPLTEDVRQAAAEVLLAENDWLRDDDAAGGGGEGR